MILLLVLVLLYKDQLIKQPKPCILEIVRVEKIIQGYTYKNFNAIMINVYSLNRQISYIPKNIHSLSSSIQIE